MMWFSRVLPILVTAAAMGCGPESSLGLHVAPLGDPQPIVNGTRDPQAVALTEAQIRAIGWLHPVSNPSQPFCTGTLVTPRLVVTAAHCAYGGSAGEIGFGVGVDPQSPEALFVSEGVFPHPEVDAALILLTEDATAGDVEIEPIPINQTALDGALVGEPAQAGGFGDTYDPSRSGRWFATVYVEQVLQEEIVVDGRGDQGICYGDSGSALVVLDAEENPVVVSVESWGDESCVDIDHMTRLDPVYDWIEPIIGGEYPEDPCADIPNEGRCVDNVAESCRRSSIRRTDCTDLGTECTYIFAADRYGCICGDLTDVGRCHGDTLEFCRDDIVRQFSCAMMSGTCGYDVLEGGYTCVETATCLPEDEAGRCDGNVLIRCANGRTTRQLCEIEGLVCEQTTDGVQCVAPTVESDAGMIDDAGEGAEVDAADDDSDGTHEAGCGCGAVVPRGDSTATTNAPVAGLLLGLAALAATRRRQRAH